MGPFKKCKLIVYFGFLFLFTFCYKTIFEHCTLFINAHGVSFLVPNVLKLNYSFGLGKTLVFEMKIGRGWYSTASINSVQLIGLGYSLNHKFFEPRNGFERKTAAIRTLFIGN